MSLARDSLLILPSEDGGGFRWSSVSRLVPPPAFEEPAAADWKPTAAG
jgi:hypothetical protein